MKNKSGFGIHVGFSSVLVTFVLICLITFATLTLVTVSSDKSLTDKSVKSVSDYYAAYSESEYIVESIYKVLEEENMHASSPNVFFSGLDTLLKEAITETSKERNTEIKDLNISIESDKVIVSYLIPYGNNALSVQIEGTYGYETEFMRILSYKTITVQYENEYTEKTFDITF